MTQARFIAVVGPSGVGKDSVMAGLQAKLHAFHMVRRVITRDAGLGGEDYVPVSPAQFKSMVARGAFALHWRAHDLSYGIPIAVHDRLHDGTDCLANLSRAALGDAAELFPNLVVLNITARPETLALRLRERGRETPEVIMKRLAKATRPLPEGLDQIDLPNDGPLAETVARALALLQQERV